MENNWNAYPRPQMRRQEWRCLNGKWKIRTGGRIQQIMVPFCPESRLSGYEGEITYGRKMTYRRLFTVPEHWKGMRILLHFGAVSRRAHVRVNKRTAAVHNNAYLPFQTDITELLQPGRNEITVTVMNDLSNKYPWGKQKEKRGGMWYTPVSGIWQSVWMEPVPENHIHSLKISTGADHADISFKGIDSGTVYLEGKSYPIIDGRVHIRLENPRLWSPEDPQLYNFTAVCGEDRIESYFALRTLTTERIGGIPRLCLNGKPYFFHAVLDQGYWSGGLYTPPSPGAFEKDILAMKSLGYNTLRKHIKVEPEQYYYDCDRLGMIVFQDMVNNGDYRYLRDTVLPTIGIRPKNDLRIHRDPETRRNFLEAMDRTVKLLYNHPCICLWTIFNEGWGQFCADEAYDRLKAMDDSRFVDSTSGWFHEEKSDVDSRHMYFEKLHLGIHDLPQLLSEFGGWSFRIPGHCFNEKKTYAYRKYNDRDTFVRELRLLYLDQVVPLAKKGLCGAIYTQVSDVEDETNGLVTYDRKVLKIKPEEFRDIAVKLADAVRFPEERGEE